MPTMKFYLSLVVFSVIFLLSSCVRDIDVDQAREIVLPPRIAIDLVYFTLESDQFTHGSSSEVRTAKDEVRLEFLDDFYIRQSLVRADFNFRYTNTFNTVFRNKIIFLSEDNLERYRIEFEIPAGSHESPALINYTEIIPEEKINAIRKAIKMRVEIEMQPETDLVEGELQLKSRVFYSFEFK